MVLVFNHFFYIDERTCVSLCAYLRNLLKFMYNQPTTNMFTFKFLMSIAYILKNETFFRVDHATEITCIFCDQLCAVCAYKYSKMYLLKAEFLKDKLLK